ncbi:MAG: hypothetical protein EA401_04270 [Planctomycetota bacterium]|nr:MAG: hypothetical protein EA401_04270 [Planctomycetota bacterium]
MATSECVVLDQAAWIECYGGLPPQSWQQALNSGWCDPHHPHYLQVSDLQWLSPEAILAYRFPDDQVPGLIPFAVTSNDDRWCWYRPWKHAGGLPVVYCPHEDEVAYAYAPDFASWVFRMVVEEYACTCLTEYHSPGRSLAILGDYATMVRPLMNETFAEILQHIAGQPLQELENGYFGTITADQAQAIISEQFADWPDFDREFEQFTGN